MKINQLLEMPIEPSGDPNDPTVYGHEKANPMSLKGRIMSARAQLKELAELAESDELVVWERITQLHKGGMFMGLAQNLEQVRHGIEELAAKRKQGGVASRGIDRNIGEQGEEQFKSPNENFASITQAPDGTFTITYNRENITLTGTPREGEIDPPLEKIPTYQQAYELAKKDYDLETEFALMPPSIKAIDSTVESYENPDEYHVLRHQTKDDIEKEMMPKGWTKIKEFDSYQEAQNAYREMKDKFPNQKFTVTSHSKKRREEQRKQWGLDEAKGPCWKKYKQVGMKEKNGKQVPNCVPKE